MTGNAKGIHYELRENPVSKENLVFVHGSGCNRKFLNALVKKLKQYNCYLIDLPDHGKSEYRDCKSVDDYITAVSEFIAELSNVTLVGHSLGGTICLGVAARNMPNVKRSVIISSGAAFDKLDRRIHDMVRKGRVNWIYLLQCLGSLWHPLVLLDCLTFEKTPVILKDFRIDTELNIEDKIPDIKKPVLLMVGRDDILTLPEYSQKIKKAVHNSELILVPGVRHMLPIVKRKTVSRHITRFITCN